MGCKSERLEHTIVGMPAIALVYLLARDVHRKSCGV